jgi:hypothetical protein
MRGESFHLVGDVLRGNRGGRLQKHVNVIGHHFQGHNLAMQVFRLAANQRPQARFDAPGEHLSAVLGTPHEVVRHRRNAAAKVAISFDAHNFNYTPVFDNWLQKTREIRRPMRSPRYPSAWLKPAVSRAGAL